MSDGGGWERAELGTKEDDSGGYRQWQSHSHLSLPSGAILHDMTDNDATSPPRTAGHRRERPAGGGREDLAKPWRGCAGTAPALGANVFIKPLSVLMSVLTWGRRRIDSKLKSTAEVGPDGPLGSPRDQIHI